MSSNSDTKCKASTRKMGNSGTTQFLDTNLVQTRRALTEPIERASTCVGSCFDDWEYYSSDDEQRLAKRANVNPDSLPGNVIKNISTPELRNILENANAEENVDVSISKKESQPPKQKTKFWEVTVGGVTFYRRAK